MSVKKELWLVFLVFVVVAGLSLGFQKPLTYHDGQGWDGVSYFQLARQLAHHQHPSAIGPFAYRLGTPWLVALLFPQQLLLGFKVVNLAACVLSTLFLALWLRRWVQTPWIRLALVLAFLTQWHAPLRFTAHYAAYTDPWLFVFLYPLNPPALRSFLTPSTLPCGKGGLGWVLAGWVLVGALFREAVVVVPLAAFLASRGRAWLPLLAGLAGIALTHTLAQQTDDYSFVRTVGQWAYNKPLPVYVHGLFIAFGPALILPVYFWRTAAAWLNENPIQAWTLGIFLLLGWVGGSDTERIVYWAMPVVYALFGVILETHALPKSFLLALAALQLLSHRVFMTLPDFPGPYPELWSYQASRSTQVLGLATHLAAVLGLWGWLRWREATASQAR